MNQFGEALFGRGYEVPDDVTVTRPVAETPGLQPEDIGVLVHLLLLPPDTAATAKDLAAGMREHLGWKMSVDRFEVIAKRLTKAGHLMRKSVYNDASKRPQWRYWAFRNPAKNPEHVAAEAETLSQVRAGIGKNPVPGQVDPRETGENPISPGQSRNQVFPDFEAEPGKTRFPSDHVVAGQSRNREKPDSPSSPPQTPPGGLVNPPTVPPRSTTPESVVAAGAGGDAMRIAQNYNPATAEIAVSDAEVEAAGVFLANLPGRWACGAEDIAKYARLLAESAKRWGWPLGEELEARLTDMTGTSQKIRGHYPRVIPARLKRLPLYAAFKRGDVAPASGQGQRPPLEGACPNHPHRSAEQCLPCQADDDHDAPAERSARPVPDEAIAAARALIGSGKTRGRQGEKTPRSEARARRQSVAARSAQAEAEAEENRLKAAALLRVDATGALGSGGIPDQADRMETAQQR
ncbi:hypothetical protein ACIBCU_37645 [Streptomyces sp. NPDC051064]|uniref:hypothetical protein n=1 Tax=Streptomyces sp. NPDC051064 TaxID=3365641 RepID=UPI003793A1F9